ncbi:hypothetical protein ABPG73_005960 [Tetrahymena malaccensis]
MEQNTTQVFTDLAYKVCFKAINDKNKPFVLHDEQRLANCLTRYVESFNVTSQYFFRERAGETKVTEKQ